MAGVTQHNDYRQCLTVNLVLGLVLGLIGACGTPAPGADPSTALPAQTINPAPDVTGSTQARETLGDLPQRVLHLIATRRFAELADWVHPDKGLRCSPHAFVDPVRDIRLPAAAVATADRDQIQHLWGQYDGTGDPIRLDVEHYIQRFVYDADYYNAAQIGYDTVLGTGNTINNAREIYPHAHIVEYHFAGFDPAYQGMDWKSLRLVFEQHQQRWYLSGIIHDQWSP